MVIWLEEFQEHVVFRLLLFLLFLHFDVKTLLILRHALAYPGQLGSFFDKGNVNDVNVPYLYCISYLPIQYNSL